MAVNMATCFKVFLFAVICPAISGYDVSCMYPSVMPDPFGVRNGLGYYFVGEVQGKGVETPYVARLAHGYDTCSWNCVAYHSELALDSNEETPWITGVPQEAMNSFSRTLCLTQCTAILDGIRVPTELYASWGLADSISFELRPDIAACNSERPCLQAIIEKDEYHPFTIGLILGEQIRQEFANDGWNSQGSMTFSQRTQEPVPCTANCRPFADLTGYTPRNHLGRMPAADKYVTEGLDMLWQPMQDFDAFGFFSTQEHVAPHASFTSHRYLAREYKSAPDPEYDYHAEAIAVVERLRIMAGDATQKASVRFFNDKLLVRGTIQATLKAYFKSVLTFEDYILFVYSISVSEYEAVLQAWNAKIKWDRVRPTTVIQRWDDDVLRTYNPALSGEGDIAARDFQAFVRVMPHSEYPSGSSCMCKAYQEFTDAWMQNKYGKPSLGPIYFPCSESTCGSTEVLQFADMSELLEVCGQSRLWAGLHFSRSISAANEICEGIGTMGHGLAETLRNGASWGDSFKQGGSRPSQTGCFPPCSSEKAQCGGKDYTGETCCVAGTECAGNKNYARCRRVEEDPACSADHGRCGGSNWTGPTCCQVGFACVFTSDWIMKCKPTAEFLDGTLRA